MTYQEAYDLALKSKWIATPCFVGESCWCNIITPETPIIFGLDDDELKIIIDENLPEGVTLFVIFEITIASF
jgi:hypothetical protein